MDREDYEDYSTASRVYDHTRVAVGVDRIAAWLAGSPVPMHEQTVLDAGCGTGNYLRALAGRVGALHGLERNHDMLARAREKLGQIDSVVLDHGSVTAMPYGDARFEGVLCNQVLHHLDDGRISGFPGITSFIAEAYRVLRPGHPLIINTSSHRQCMDGFWWADLVAEAMQRIIERLPSIHVLRAMLERAGFHVEHIVADRTELQGKEYFDPRGPLDPRWRAGESTWALATEAELERALARVREMNDSGTMQSYLDGREALRRDLGQTTFICARRPA
jgi:ubiquinone/menaquinone biosynthesis C-methylase UbiE